MSIINSVEYKDLVKKYNLKESKDILRYKSNPILSRKDIPYNAHLIFNAGVTKFNNKYIMIFRNDYYVNNDSITKFHTDLGLAISSDGIHFKVNKKPFIKYDDINKGENVRIYDPRLIVISNDLYMCFALDTHHGIRGGIMKINKDLKSYKIISLSTPDNRNMVLFPEKINGMYVRLERPMPIYSRRNKEIFDTWISYSKDLKYWGESKLLLATEDVKYCNCKLGPACPPLKTKKGYIVIFHSVIKDEELGKNGYEDKWQKVYVCGVMLLDLKDPSKILGISNNPLLIPKEEYELKDGFRNNVIFPCGVLINKDTCYIYYGANDTSTCLASIKVNKLIEYCLKK